MAGATIRVVIGAQLLSSQQNYRNAGISRFLRTLLAGLDQLASEQQQVTALIAGTSDYRPTRGVSAVATSWPVNTPTRRILWEQLGLPRQARALQVDVYHGPAQVLPIRLPAPAVLTIHDLAFLRYPQYFRPGRRVYQRLMTTSSTRRAAIIVAASHSTRDDLIQLLGVPASKVAVVHPAIDADFVPITDARELSAFRARHGLPERYLLYLGTMEPRKNVVGLVDAYARLLAGSDGAVPPLMLAGAPGWYHRAIEERIAALGLGRQVRVVGYVAREEQPLWYASATAFVYPSLYEGFGLPVAEALACGTPVITSNVSSLPEVGGPIARLVAPGDPEGLAQAMRETLASGDARAKAAHEGPIWTRQFSPGRMAQAYAECYAHAFSTSRTPQGGERAR